MSNAELNNHTDSVNNIAQVSSTHKEGSLPHSALKQDDSSSLHTETKNSLEDLPAQVEDYGPPLPPDGGWGWAVTAASFLINLIVDGICYTFGIFLSEIVDYFETSRGKAALAGSMIPAMYLIVGPIASSLANRFGCRVVAISGSLLSCFAFIVCIFSPNIEIMTLTYGVLGGVGFGLMYLPSIVMVGFYFDKKRAMATGIAVCGSGIGTFVFAPLGTLLVDTYGWKGANIIFGAISLHGIVCALVFRPLPARRVTVSDQSQVIQSIVEEKKRRRCISTGSLDGSVITKENRLIKERMAVAASRDVIPEAENEDVTTPPKDKSSKMARVSLTDDTSVNNVKPTENGVKESSMLSIPQPKQLERIKQLEAGSSTRSMGSSSSVNYHGSVIVAPTGEEKKQIESPFNRQDIFYAGSVTSIAEYKESKDMIDYVQSITSIPAVRGAEAVEEPKKKCKYMPNIVTQMLDFSLLKCFTFIVACLAGVFVFIGLYTPFVYVSEKAVALGVDRSKANLIISCLGIFNTIGRLGAGLLADRPWADSLVIHNASAILAGVATCLVPLLNSFELLMTYAVVFGTCIAAFIALRSIVFVELLGIQRLTNSFGLTSLFQGLAILLGSPLSGAILDATQSYTVPFIVSGSMIIIGGVICLPARRIAAWEKSKREYRQVQCNREP